MELEQLIESYPERIPVRQGQEHYSHVTINGQPVPSTGTFPRNIGFTSTGEFASLLVDLFTSPGVAEFKFRKEAMLRGIPVAVYEFHIPSGKNTFWTLRDSKGRTLRPELRGELWLELQSGRSSPRGSRADTPAGGLGVCVSKDNH